MVGPRTRSFVFRAAVAATACGFSSTAFAADVTSGAKTSSKKATTFRLLNNPEQKVNSRIKSLQELKQRLKAMTDQKLLADQKPHLQVVITKIDTALEQNKKENSAGKEKLSSEEQLKELNKVAKDVQQEVEGLKSDLMKKAMQLAQEQHDLMAKRFQNTKVVEEQKTAEEAFEKLMDVQDSPLQEQLSVLEKYKSDEFVAQFLKSEKFQEGENLAMKLGQALDNRKEIEAKNKEAKELQALQSGAHLSQDQAKTLLPILQKVREQKRLKQRRLNQVSNQLSKLEDQARVYRKRKAVLTKEEHVLNDAVDAIQHGKIDRLTKAMDTLKALQP
ncbi:unnamed protein product [Amoebophrya sp. A120]|nr:unnamed protein product [Amoebophrya sp. A120]|eukprot:GSA120T00017052001.1